MTLQKAIKIETIDNDHNPCYTDKDRSEAHQLAIEAMKRLLLAREGLAPRDDWPLPGETDD